MKKYISIFVLVAFALLLVACNGNGNGNGNGNENKIALSYADWGDLEFNEKMIDAFEEKYPHITVELRTDIAGSGEEFTGNLITAAEVGLLPDVFATDNVPTIVARGLTKDVASLWNNDDDAKLVYEYMADTAVYGEKRYAVPSFQFLKGIMINLDIFENANLT